MIDREVFARVMGGFADRIGRALAPATAEMYFDVLSGALDTEQFLAGARIVFRTHAYNTWPSPQLFIDAAKPPAAAKLSGAEAFEQVLKLTNDPRIQNAGTQIALLGPVVERAYRAAGGFREFHNILTDDVKWLRRTFLETFEMVVEHETANADAMGALASVHAPRLGHVDDAAGQLVRGLAQLKAFPKTGRDRAAGDT